MPLVADVGGGGLAGVAGGLAGKVVATSHGPMIVKAVGRSRPAPVIAFSACPSARISANMAAEKSKDMTTPRESLRPWATYPAKGMIVFRYACRMGFPGSGTPSA